VDELNIGADLEVALGSVPHFAAAKRVSQGTDLATLSRVNVATHSVDGPMKFMSSMFCGLSTIGGFIRRRNPSLRIRRIVADNKLSMAGRGLFLANVHVGYGEIRPTRMEQMLRRAEDNGRCCFCSVWRRADGPASHAHNKSRAHLMHKCETLVISSTPHGVWQGHGTARSAKCPPMNQNITNICHSSCPRLARVRSSIGVMLMDGKVTAYPALFHRCVFQEAAVGKCLLYVLIRLFALAEPLLAELSTLFLYVDRVHISATY
jgi:hypothetical protein